MALLPVTADSHFRDAFREADNFFANFLAPHHGHSGGMMLPGAQQPAQPSLRIIPVDVTETTEAYQLKADIPGVKKEDVTLDLDENVIKIGVAKKSEEAKEEESPDKRWHRSERKSFYEVQERALRMPENTDFTKMTVSFEHGVLTIDVKKLPEQNVPPKYKRIEIP